MAQLRDASRAQKSRRYSFEASDARRKNIKETFDSVLANVRTADEFIFLIQSLLKIKNPSPDLIEAASAVDFLAPLRNSQNPGPTLEREKLRRYVESQLPPNDLVDGPALHKGLELIETPASAKKILLELLAGENGLAMKSLWHGSPLHRSFLASIANLPKDTRDSLVKELMQVRSERLKSFKKGSYELHSDAEEAKMAVRDVQFLQTILLRQEFSSLIQTLNTTYRKSGANKQFLASLENHLLRTRLGEPSYTFSTVMDVARTLQATLKTRFSKGDSVEIFGSFPNMNADLKSSDIDVLFSSRLDAQVRQEIKGGMMGDGGLSAAEARERTGRAKELTLALVEMEKKAATILGISRPQGQLLGLSVLPMTQTTRGLLPELSREEFMRMLTVISNVTVVITADQIVLRIYDSVSPVPEAHPVIYEYPL